MDETEYERLFALFIKDHPEHASGRFMVDFPNGRELGIQLETAEAFARWCQFNGHGDPKRLLGFLTAMPDIVKHFDGMEQHGPRWGSGNGSVLG